MTFLRYSAQAATDDPGWMQSTVWLNVDGDVLSRRLINEPSSVDLVKTFTADTDSSALVLHLLQTLTYDAVVALQSLHHSNITRHVIAVEEVLRSYSTVRYSSITPHLCHPCHPSNLPSGTFSCSFSAKNAVPLTKKRVTNFKLLKGHS